MKQRLQGSVLAACLALLTGCGGYVVDEDRAAGELQSEVEDAVGIELEGAECPEGIDADSGTRFRCTLDRVGTDLLATLEVVNADGDLKLIELHSD